MWQLVKSELKYYRIAFTAPIFFTILFQIIEFYILKTTSGMRNNLTHFKNIDLWSGYYTFVLLYSIFSIWSTRFKEKRERLSELLPVSHKQLALSRLWLTSIPFVVLLLYFITVKVIVINIWNIELSVPLLQIGLVFTLSAGLILVRDAWFSHWSSLKRFQAVFVPTSVILIIVVAILLNPFDSYGNSALIISEYVDIMFYLIGSTIMIITIFSYQKRKSYLS